MARPKTDIDFVKVNEYLQAQCSGTSIAGILGVCPETLYSAIEEKYKVGFSVYSAQKKSEGKEILKKTLWDTATVKGNVVMQIWLSKQYLGMSESLEKLSDEAIELIIAKLKEKYNEKSKV
jgi:hypothetical protein